jgi:hypothetical protein
MSIGLYSKRHGWIDGGYPDTMPFPRVGELIYFKHSYNVVVEIRYDLDDQSTEIETE